MSGNGDRGAASFVRLWFVLFFSYVCLRVAYDLLLKGWLDLRPVALLDLLVVPLGQSLVVWSISRARRRPQSASSS
jgi:hypothetical protein